MFIVVCVFDHEDDLEDEHEDANDLGNAHAHGICLTITKRRTTRRQSLVQSHRRRRWLPCESETQGLLTGFIGLPMIGGSAVFAAIGVPLWVLGSRPRHGGHAELPAWVPAVAPARNGAALRWTF